MAKGTMASSKAMQSGFGIQSGTIKVVSAQYRTIQRTKTDGTVITPFFALSLGVTKCGPDLKPINEEDIEEKDLIYCWGSKESTDGEHSFAFHPGIGKSPSDSDPKDQGVAIGASGNTVWRPDDSEYRVFGDSDSNLFAKGLELQGWSEEVNDQCWAPNYVGMVLDVKTVTKVDLCKKLGIRYRPQAGREADTAWEIVKIHVKPYESKQPARKATATVAKSNGSVNTGAEALAVETMKKIAEWKEFKGHEGVQLSKVRAAVATQLHREKRPKEVPAVTKFTKDDDWIVNTGAELGFLVDIEGGTVSFSVPD